MAYTIVRAPSANKDGSASPFDSIRRYRADGSEFWYARELLKWLGYVKWQNAQKAIERAMRSLRNQGHNTDDHFTEVSNDSRSNGLGVQSIQDFELSRLACYTVAMNADPEKEMVALAQGYFSTKTREAEVVIPAQNDRIRELELENENLRLKSNLVDKQSSMIAMHGKEIVLVLNGRADAIVHEQVKVTEVINLNTGDTAVFLSADQLKAEVKKRSGQVVKSQKQFTDALRKANRDDLLVAVNYPPLIVSPDGSQYSGGL